mgnify:CR=1 FL=1
MDKNSAYLLLNLLPDIGPWRIKRLIEHFGEIENVFSASLNDLCKVEDIGEILAKRILSAPKEVDLDKELHLIEKYQVRIITWDSPDYPANLKTLPDPPAVIYLRGELKDEDIFAISIVGTRRATVYGKTVTEKLASGLAEARITVISGLARGIDTSAHQTAINAKGRTIAVLGNGLAVHYPPENRKLEEKIITSGALISEFPMTSSPDRANFPRRNRIIAGLSFGVVVIEADIKSGALITARLALEQGREVFAVPGNIFSACSRGTHMLIKQGAKLVEETEDIIEEIIPLKERWQAQQKKPKPVADENLTSEEKKIYTYLPSEPVSIDFLLERVSLPIGKISQLLLSLEMKGLIKPLAGKMYQRLST